MLEKLRGRTLVVNDPRGLRDANEKLYTLHFARHMPRTLVTADRDRIHRFVAEVGTGVVKPLDGAGGSGVMVVAKRRQATRGRSSTTSPTRERGTRWCRSICRPCARATSASSSSTGRSSAAINRIARDDDVRSNIHAGGRVEPCEVTAEERAVVADMAPRLAADGLVFVGLDFIGGRLTEVNVTSPTGIQELSRHAGRDVAEDVIAWVERRVGRLPPAADEHPARLTAARHAPHRPRPLDEPRRSAPHVRRDAARRRRARRGLRRAPARPEREPPPRVAPGAGDRLRRSSTRGARTAPSSAACAIAPRTSRIVRSGDLVRVGRVWIELRVDQSPSRATSRTRRATWRSALVAQALDDDGDRPDDQAARPRGARPGGGRCRWRKRGASTSSGAEPECDLPLADADVVAGARARRAARRRR